MREILFRGFHPDEKGSTVIVVDGKEVRGDWMEGFLLSESRIGYYRSGYDFAFHKVIPETVGELTGLTDKNGKKIFEGDIIEKRFDDCIVQFEIIYNFAGFAFKSVKIGDLYCFDKRYLEMEVIGNIHDKEEK